MSNDGGHFAPPHLQRIVQTSARHHMRLRCAEADREESPIDRLTTAETSRQRSACLIPNTAHRRQYADNHCACVCELQEDDAGPENLMRPHPDAHRGYTRL